MSPRPLSDLSTHCRKKKIKDGKCKTEGWGYKPQESSLVSWGLSPLPWSTRDLKQFHEDSFAEFIQRRIPLPSTPTKPVPTSIKVEGSGRAVSASSIDCLQ